MGLMMSRRRIKAAKAKRLEAEISHHGDLPSGSAPEAAPEEVFSEEIPVASESVEKSVADEKPSKKSKKVK
jgi:hypothetical protein